MAAFLLVITSFIFWQSTNGKLQPLEQSIDFAAEIDQIKQRWDADQRKWFDFMFDPNYDITTYDLYYGTSIPAIGVHTKHQDNLFQSLVFAMRLGYRYLHTSLSFGNEQHIAKAVGTVGINRHSLFLTLAVDAQHFGYTQTQNAIRSFLRRTELKYIDICIMDSPQVILDEANAGGLSEEERLWESAKVRRLTWLALEALHEDGRCLNLGIAHFEKPHIKELLSFAKIKPSVNMMEVHPYNTRKKLRKYLVQEKMVVISEEVLNPTGDHALLKEPMIKELGVKYSKTPSQIVLKWAMQQGIVVLPADNHKRKIADHGQTLGFELEYNDLDKISRLNKDQAYSKTYDAVNSFKWNKKAEAEFQLVYQRLLDQVAHDTHQHYKAYRQELEKQEL